MPEKVIRTINGVRNPKWMNAEHTSLDCEVDFGEFDEAYVPFTANKNDNYSWSKIIFDDCVAGKYGVIEEFDVTAFEAQHLASEQAEKDVKAKYDASLDKWKALGLTEDDLKNLGI